jgi:hypothetical protein
VLKGGTTPEGLNASIAEDAKKIEAAGPRARHLKFRFYRAGNPTEYEALGRYAVILISVLTQKPEELPVKSLYIRTAAGDVPLRKVSSWRSELDGESLVAKMFGRHREDGFYLLPTSVLYRDGQVMIDLTAGRTAAAILQLPSKAAQVGADKLPKTDPAPNARPNLKVLQTFIARNFPGFPLPKAVP